MVLTRQGPESNAQTLTNESRAGKSPRSPRLPLPKETASTAIRAPRRAWLASALLTLIFVFSFIERQILNLLVGPIQRDLDLSDTQMSLLQGLGQAWSPSYLLRVHGMSLAEAGARYGVIALVAGSLGVLCGPFVARALEHRGYRDAQLRIVVPALLLLL